MNSASTGTVLVRPHTLPVDAGETGVFGVAAAYLPSSPPTHQCSQCGHVDLSDGVVSAAFVRSSIGPGELDVIRSVADWVLSRRPSHVVTLSTSHRDVLRDRAEVRGYQNGFIDALEVLDGGLVDECPRDLLDASGVSMDYPVLRGTVIRHTEISDVGSKVVSDAAGVEVSCVRNFCAREVRALLRALVKSDSLAF